MNTSANKVDRYTNMTSSFLGPSQSAARSSKAIHVMASTAQAVYNLLIGDDISTLSDPNASTFSKILAGADIASNFFPVGAFGKIGGELAIKGGLKAAKLLKEPAKAAIQAGKDTIFGGVKKFASWFGKSKKVVSRGTGEAETTAIQTYWPPNRGFSGTPKVETLQPGIQIDRYGGPAGNFTSPEGTPFWARALPPESLKKPYLKYEVLKPVNVNSGKAAPWFGQPGMGTQYEFSKSIQQLVDDEVLRGVRD